MTNAPPTIPADVLRDYIESGPHTGRVEQTCEALCRRLLHVEVELARAQKIIDVYADTAAKHDTSTVARAALAGIELGRAAAQATPPTPAPVTDEWPRGHRMKKGSDPTVCALCGFHYKWWGITPCEGKNAARHTRPGVGPAEKPAPPAPPSKPAAGGDDINLHVAGELPARPAPAGAHVAGKTGPGPCKSAGGDHSEKAAPASDREKAIEAWRRQARSVDVSPSEAVPGEWFQVSGREIDEAVALMRSATEINTRAAPLDGRGTENGENVARAAPCTPSVIAVRPREHGPLSVPAADTKLREAAKLGADALDVLLVNCTANDGQYLLPEDRQRAMDASHALRMALDLSRPAPVAAPQEPPSDAEIEAAVLDMELAHTAYIAQQDLVYSAAKQAAAPTQAQRTESQEKKS